MFRLTRLSVWPRRDTLPSMMRVLISALLSLMLVITSSSMAVARNSDPATDTLVICAGENTYVIYVDGQGVPTAAPHICPDCALQDIVAILPHAGGAARLLARGQDLYFGATVWAGADRFTRARARAPPGVA